MILFKKHIKTKKASESNNVFWSVNKLEKQKRQQRVGPTPCPSLPFFLLLLLRE